MSVAVRAGLAGEKTSVGSCASAIDVEFMDLEAQSTFPREAAVDPLSVRGAMAVGAFGAVFEEAAHVAHARREVHVVVTAREGLDAEFFEGILRRLDVTGVVAGRAVHDARG